MPPFASYCLATFNRPKYLHATLISILSQADADFEIIVSDNDPAASARDVTKALNDPRIHYSHNSINLGMVRNFNAALAKASGSYVVMITDDDPIYPHHLSTLRQLAEDYPAVGAYFGAGDVYHESEFIAACSNTRPGLVRARLETSTHCYDARAFLARFFGNRIPFYMLWSCGMVRRDIAQQTQMPDYGSPFLTDFAYISLVASHSGAALIHTALGRQNVHNNNFGRRQFDELPLAINGFVGLFREKDVSTQTRASLNHFLERWTAAHLWFLKRYFKNDPELLSQLDTCIESIIATTPLKNLRKVIVAVGLRQSIQSLIALVPVYLRFGLLRRD